MVNAYDTLSDGQSWTHTIQNEVGTALGAVDSVGFFPIAPFTFEIFKSGSTFYRRDGVNGEIDDSSASADTLIDNAITACSDGDSIWLAAEDYGHIDGITIDSEIAFVGQHPYFTHLYSNQAVDIITVTADNVILKNFRVNGYGSNNPTSGIYFDDGRFGYLENVRVQSVNNNAGIKLEGYSTVLVNPVLTNNLIGIQLQAGTSYNPNNITVVGGRISSNVTNAIGLEVDAGDTLKVYSLDVETSGTGAKGIYISKTGNSSMQLFAPRLEGVVGTYMANGIYWDSGKGGEDNIYSPYFVYVTTKVTNKPDSTKFYNGPGYVIDADGSSTGTAATQNIAHGMHETPNRITFGQTSIGTGYPVQTSGANATYIFVSAGSGVTYDWHAWKA